MAQESAILAVADEVEIEQECETFKWAEDIILTKF